MKKRFDVTIAGEINLDLILYGLPEVMPVERELLAKDFRLTLGSSSAIVAHNLAALGVSVGFITRLGDDPLGSIALERLAEKGVDISHVKRVSGGTSTGVTILLTHEGKRHTLTYPGTMFEMAATDLDMDYLASARHFHLSSLFLHRALQPDLPRILRQLKDGDSFDAGFLAAYLRGEAPEACAAFGNRTGALSTLRAGGTESFRDAGLVKEYLAPVC